MSWLRIALVTALIAVVTLPAGLLAGLFVSGVAAFTVFSIGWFLLVPAIPIIYALYRTRDQSTSDDPENEHRALEELKRRYAAGEIDEATFEARAERLLELDAIERADIRDIDVDPQPSAESETKSLERERTNR